MAAALVIGLASGVLVSRATLTRGQNVAAHENDRRVESIAEVDSRHS